MLEPSSNFGVSAHPDRARRLAEVATLLAHDENLPFDPVVPPIYQTSLFTFRSYRDMEEAFSGRVRFSNLNGYAVTLNNFSDPHAIEVNPIDR